MSSLIRNILSVRQDEGTLLIQKRSLIGIVFVMMMAVIGWAGFLVITGNKARATAFEYASIHPQAIKQSVTSTGRQLKSLVAWNDKIYSGYGDYDRNTGPVSITPFDPITNSFASTPEHVADTESIEVWQTIGDKLHALHVDPKSHYGAAYSVADKSSGSVVWKNMAKPVLTHVYAITTGANDSEIFVSGSLDGGSASIELGKIYRSTDGGATWTESLNIPSRGGFNRVTLLAKIGDKVYAQNSSSTDFAGSNTETKGWVLGNNGWKSAKPIAQSFYPYKGTEFNGRIIAQSTLYGGSLVAYDGRNTTLARASIRDFKVHSDGYVYALSTSNQNNDLSVMRSNDLTNWELITPTPNNATSLAVLNNTIYIGTSDSELYRAEIDNTVIDSTPPSATFVTPTTEYTATTDNVFIVNATDTASIDRVDFYIEAHHIGTAYNKMPGTANEFRQRWDGSVVAPGTYQLKAIAYDIYGNSSATEPVAIIIPEGLYPPDTQSPVVTINSPSITQRVRKTVWINASATDNDRVASMEAMLDGIVVATSSNNNLSASIPLTRGQHTLVVTAKDRAGNTSQQTVSFSSK